MSTMVSVFLVVAFMAAIGIAGVAAMFWLVATLARNGPINQRHKGH